MFYKLLRNDNYYTHTIQQMPKVSADKPHRLQQMGLLKDLTSKSKKFINDQESPVFKLKWNLEKKKIPNQAI